MGSSLPVDMVEVFKSEALKSEALKLEAVKLFKEGNYEQAIVKYLEEIHAIKKCYDFVSQSEVDPNKEQDKAILLTKIQRRAVNSASNISTCHYKLKDYKSAEFFNTEAMKLSPDSGLILLRRAIIMVKLGNNDEAAICYIAAHNRLGNEQSTKAMIANATLISNWTVGAAAPPTVPPLQAASRS